MGQSNAERQALWRERRQARIQELETEVALLQKAFQEKPASTRSELAQAICERDEARAIAERLFNAFKHMFGAYEDVVAGLRAAYEYSDLDDDDIETIETYIEGLGALIKAQ